MLSGEDLVSKHLLKTTACLPQIGSKEVLPKGTWLEHKQIQAALDSRKQLLQIERIEKCGSISHAEWRDDLMLAQVTQSVGSSWQFFGHNVGSNLFLYPEEALFLLETNRLLLKFNNVPVSLQQAHAVLLPDKASTIKYKVYANLSRLGYRVYRHDKKKFFEQNNKSETLKSNSFVNAKNVIEDVIVEEKIIENKLSNEDSVKDADSPIESKSSKMNTENNIVCKSRSRKRKHSNDKSAFFEFGIEQENKYRKLKKHQKCCKSSVEFPDCYQKQSFILQSPHKKFIPKSISLKSSYSIILNKMNTTSKQKTELVDLSIDESTEVSPAQGSLTNTTQRNNYNINDQYYSSFHAGHLNIPPQNYWRHFPGDFNFINQNADFPRYFMPYARHNHRFFPYRPRNRYPNSNFNYNHVPNYQRFRRYKDNMKRVHLNSIKRLVFKLRALVSAGSAQKENIDALNHLLNTFNVRYKTRLQLTKNIVLIDLNNVTETIEIEDESSCSTQPTLEKKIGYNTNLEKLKELSKRLADMEKGKMATSRHKRVLMKAINIFNKSYDVQIELSDDFELLEKQLIVLESSSETELVEEEPVKICKRKVKNPFNIMKQIAEEQSKIENTQLLCDNNQTVDFRIEYKYTELIKNTFAPNWLPTEDSFGRAEVISQSNCGDLTKTELIYDFYKTQPLKYNNWLDLKLSFWESYNKTAEIFKRENKYNHSNNEDMPKSSVHDCFDINSALCNVDKIKFNDETSNEGSLSIDFDIYNRDVKNFKKTNKPKPHFRIICLEESSPYPAGADLATLHSEYYEEKIVFAIVGFSAITYLQLDPNEAPLNIPNNNVTSRKCS